MPALKVQLNAEGMLEDVKSEKLAVTEETIQVGALPRGMDSGKPSVLIAMHLPHDGGTVAGQTSLALFLTAALAFYAAYGDAGTNITISAGRSTEEAERDQMRTLLRRAAAAIDALFMPAHTKSCLWSQGRAKECKCGAVERGTIAVAQAQRLAAELHKQYPQ